jgi:outer membrane lipoprotein-sorting protein
MRYFLLSLLGVFCQVCAAAGLPAAIESCMRGNLPESTSVQSIELRARDRSHYESVLQADVFLKRNGDGNARILLYFREPVDIRGARFLVVQKQADKDMYIYMPSLFKVRRITSRQISNSMMGTDFSYEDFERLQGVLPDLQAEQQEDMLLGGRPVYVLVGHPAGDSGYEKITSYIDKESCIALRTELYEHGDQLRKQLTVDPSDLRKRNGIWFPSELLMKDLRDKTETRLKVTNLKLDVQLPDGLFDETRLKQVEIPDISP